MLSRTMQDALNEQIKQEFYSSYVYLSMAAYFDSINLPGFAAWMRLQAGEEVDLEAVRSALAIRSAS